MKKANFFPVFGDGKYRMQPVSVLSVAQGYAGSIDNEKAYYKTFDVCGPRIYEFDELIEALAKIINREVYKIHIPLFIVKLLVYLFGRFESSPINYEGLLMLLEDNVCESKDFYSTLNIEPIAFEDGVRKYAGI
jgi:NADH dehydrogenase